MKFLLLTLGLLVGAAWIGTPARAQNYPWCAALNMGDVSYNCGFDTEAQCRATVSGIGGWCEKNTQYLPPEAPPAPVPFATGVPVPSPRAQNPSPH
jgi:uncharacterized protein DUF3551